MQCAPFGQKMFRFKFWDGVTDTNSIFGIQGKEFESDIH